MKRGSSGLARGGRLKAVSKTEDRLQADKLQRDKRTAFYEQCWEKLPRHSEISPDFKFRTYNRTNYHHILAKSKYPEIQYSFKVIICVTWDEHAMLESNPEIFEQAAEKKKYCLEHWDELVEESKQWEQEYEHTQNTLTHDGE